MNNWYNLVLHTQSWNQKVRIFFFLLFMDWFTTKIACIVKEEFKTLLSPSWMWRHSAKPWAPVLLVFPGQGGLGLAQIKVAGKPASYPSCLGPNIYQPWGAEVGVSSKHPGSRVYLVDRELLSNCSNYCYWKPAGVSPEPEGASCGATTIVQSILVWCIQYFSDLNTLQFGYI